MTTLSYFNWAPSFLANFSNRQTLDGLISVIEESPLLVNMLNNFGGQVSLSPNVGTGYDAPNIEIGSYYLPQNGKNSNYSPVALADALGHELGHALLPNGHVSTANASNVATALQNGLTDEGSAISSEFVVIAQLGMAAGLSGSALNCYIAQYTGFSQALITQLFNAMGGAQNVQSFTSLSYLESSSYLATATTDGADWTQNQRPSYAGPAPSPSKVLQNPDLAFNYTSYYQDGWVLANLFNVGSSSVNWTQFTQNTIVVNGSYYSGSNIPLLANTGLTVGLSTVSVGANVNNEKLSFTGGSPQNQYANAQGVVTLFTPSSATTTRGCWGRLSAESSATAALSRINAMTDNVNVASSPLLVVCRLTRKLNERAAAMRESVAKGGVGSSRSNSSASNAR